MKKLILTVLIALLYASSALGLGLKQWKAGWDANTETDLAGYYLYWKASGGEFNDTNRIDCGNSLELILTGVVPYGSIIALTAYDTSLNESEDYSNEVPFDKDGDAPGVVGGISIVEVE